MFKCPYCNIKMKSMSKSYAADFYSYIEGLRSPIEFWEECPQCHSKNMNFNWYPENVILANEKQLKYIKYLFMNLKLYRDSNFKWHECNDLLYCGDNKAIKLTKDKADMIIKHLSMFTDFEDWNSRISKYINKNIENNFLKTLLPSKLDLFISVMCNGIPI